MRWTRVRKTTLSLGMALMTSGCNEPAPWGFSRGLDRGGGMVWVHLPPARKVDFLFVIDDSPGSAELQARLARSSGAFVDYLEHSGEELDYRIGVASTHVSSPMCGEGEDAGGTMRLESCLDHLDRLGPQEQWACTSACQHTGEALGFGSQSPPWLDAQHWRSSSGGSMKDALSCAFIPGTRGCAYSSPLEAMRLALRHNLDFLRSDASLMVVFITDAEDCSPDANWEGRRANPATNELGRGDGEPGVCWHAGVHCEPSGGVLRCASSDSGVLSPVWEYTEFLSDLEADKKAHVYSSSVELVVIAGVDPHTGRPAYHRGPHALPGYDIDPGCIDQSQGGHELLPPPPVRLAELVDESEGSMMSVCSSDYSWALIGAAHRAVDELQRACYTPCVADFAPDEAAIQAHCTVTQRVGSSESVVEECLRDGAGRYRRDQDGAFMPEASSEAAYCYTLRNDPAGETPSPHDDLHQSCLEAEAMLEFEFHRNPRVELAQRVELAAHCNDGLPGVGD